MRCDEVAAIVTYSAYLPAIVALDAFAEVRSICVDAVLVFETKCFAGFTLRMKWLISVATISS